MSEQYDVQLTHITKKHNEKTIVRDLSLTVKKGEFLSILGPSGCGKTTTLRMIGGFLEPDSGDIYIRGENVSRLPPGQRNTSMVFQDYALFPHMNVADNIGFGLRMRGVPKTKILKQVHQVLDLVGLKGFENRKPSQLSGGQRQRIALARSLVLQPAILLLDEPLGALDAQIRKQMQLELKKLQTSLEQTFIYVTHDQEEAMTMSDEIAIMKDGIIEQVGSPANIYDNPQTLFVAGFLGECSVVRGSCSNNGIFSCDSLGQIYGRFTGQPFSGTAALCLRPENILFIPEAQSVSVKDYAFPAVIRQRVFKGMNTWLSAECGGLQFFTEITGKSTLNMGDRVTLAFNASDAMIVPVPENEV